MTKAGSIGLYTNALEPMLAFWQGEVGAKPLAVVPMAPGRTQHRLGFGEFIIKINHYEDALTPAGPSGYLGLTLLGAASDLTDPDGNRVTLTPDAPVTIHVAAIDPGAAAAFYVGAFGFAPQGERLRLGDVTLHIVPGPAQPTDAPMNAQGWRYLTLEVADCTAAHAQALSLGATESSPVRTFGANQFSLIRDPAGNWLEIVQRP
jgi:catechol 2,3-dioxygenase-like lactoylglutathione lyase family enzyme